MGKFTLLIFVLFLMALGYFALYNTDPITVTITPKAKYETSKIALILISSAAGAALMLIYFFVRDTRRFIDNRQIQRRQKKDVRIQELYSKALNGILADNEEEAKTALEAVLSEEPAHMDALLRLGDIAAENEEYQKAVDYYKKAREVQPGNIETLFSLEKVMEKTGKASEALMYLEKILELDPDNLAALYRKRSFLEKKDRWDDLVTIQKTIIKSEHNEKDRRREQTVLVGYKYEQGRFNLENGEIEKADKAFKTIIRLDKSFIPAYLGIAEALVRSGNPGEAATFLEKSFEQTSSLIILARLEDILINLGDPARLIKFYKNSLSKNPQDQALRFFMGKLFYRLEMIDDAYDTLTAVDAGSALYAELNELLANIYLRRGQYEKAVDEFKKVVDIKKTSRLVYCCSNCAYSSKDWSGRCPNCKEWNTYKFNLYGICKA